MIVIIIIGRLLMAHRQVDRFTLNAHRHAFDFGGHILTLGALGLLFFETGAIIGQHAEIMVRKLKIIFRHHPVALHLGVTRKILIFFEQLRRIATRTIVDTIALFRTMASTAATALRARSTAITTTIVIIILAIVDHVRLSKVPDIRPNWGMPGF
jgi:hypothetical protein